MSNDNAPRLIKQVKVAKKAENTQPEKKTLKPLDKKVVIKVKKKVVVRTTKPHMTVKDNVEDQDLEKKNVKVPVEKDKGKAPSSVRKSENKSKVITSTSRTGGDPLRNGPVIIRRNNLPPINSTKTNTTASSTGPRQVGVVGGKVFTRTRYNKDSSAPRTGYNRNNNNYNRNGSGSTGGYNNNGTGGYNNNRTGGYNNSGTGGYNNNRTGGYNNNGTGGYNNNRTGGYNNNGSGGYNNNRPGGYNNNRPGGYNNNGSGGYNNNRPNFNNRNTTGTGGNFRRPFNSQNNNNRKPNSNEPSPSSVATKNKRVFYNKKRPAWDKRSHEKSNEGKFSYQRKKDNSVNLNAIPKSIDILANITVSELAKKMNLKASEIINKLFGMGMMVTINQQIDSDTATLIADEYNCSVHLVNLYDETIIETEEVKDEDLESRAPIVTVMGHVDHGKTKLLDAIRSTKVAEGEFGGITQHIGAYKVPIEGRGDIVFLDTPGHAAFTMMRARGAQLTDIVILVVAANDGVMPQTIEAIDHAKAAKVPIIVAINKCDLPEANPERVMQQLSAYDLMPEEWGGQTLYCQISALKKQGIDKLLDTVLLQAEMLDLKATKKGRAEGKVLEARVDQGRGSVATVIINKGTIRVGDYYVGGIYFGRVRALFDDRGNRIQEAGPSTPVEISGLSGIPSAGDPFQVTEDEKQAKLVGNKRQELERLGQASKFKKVTLDNLYEKIKDGEMQELNVIIKGDVQGSVEALQKALEDLSTPEIRLSVIRAQAGAIIENDITLASASENSALVIGFNVRPTPKAQQLAEQEKIDIRKYNVIYTAVDDIKAAMEGMLAPDKTEADIGKVEVRQVYNIPKIGLIAGCYVTEGKVKRNNLCRVIRDSIQLNKELVTITSLKRFKDDAKEVATGFECGIGIEGFNNLKEGDILEIVEIKEIKRTLDDTKTKETKDTKETKGTK